jgi:hypothetical protein
MAIAQKRASSAFPFRPQPRPDFAATDEEDRPSCGLTADRYSLTQLRYDLRKLKAHGLLERMGRTYAYRLTDKGIRAGTLLILFHKRVCGPLANSLFQHRPED